MKAEEKGMVVKRVIDLQAEWGNVTGQKPRFSNADVVALSNIRKNSEAVKAFCEAYDEAVEWTNQNPHEAAILTAKYVEGVNAPAFEESQILEMEGGSIELESVDDDAKARFEELLKR